MRTAVSVRADATSVLATTVNTTLHNDRPVARVGLLFTMLTSPSISACARISYGTSITCALSFTTQSIRCLLTDVHGTEWA